MNRKIWKGLMMSKYTKIVIAIILTVLVSVAVVDFYHQAHPVPPVVEYKDPNFPEF